MTVKQPRLGGQKSASADGDDAAGGSGHRFDPAHELAGQLGVVDAGPAGQYDGVDGFPRVG